MLTMSRILLALVSYLQQASHLHVLFGMYCACLAPIVTIVSSCRSLLCMMALPLEAVAISVKGYRA